MNCVNYIDTIDSFLESVKRNYRRSGKLIEIHQVNKIDFQVPYFGTIQACDFYFCTSRTVHSLTTFANRTWLEFELSKYGVINGLISKPKEISCSKSQLSEMKEKNNLGVLSLETIFNKGGV